MVKKRRVRRASVSFRDKRICVFPKRGTVHLVSLLTRQSLNARPASMRPPWPFAWNASRFRRIRARDGLISASPTGTAGFPQLLPKLTRGCLNLVVAENSSDGNALFVRQRPMMR